MKIAIYIKDKSKQNKTDLQSLFSRLREEKNELYFIDNQEDVRENTELLLSVGGDGTFLSAAKRLAGKNIPILGVNLGRLGFLSEYSPAQVGEALSKGDFQIEERTYLQLDASGGELKTKTPFSPYALNEIAVQRLGASILGIKIAVNGIDLPTYWADGLLIATASGSTAYSLSVGGPICLPETKVLIISPIAPHNLNVRPLIIPHDAEIELSFYSRDENIRITMDNRSLEAPKQIIVKISKADFKLKRVKLGKSGFFNALRTKFHWGEDVRNEV